MTAVAPPSRFWVLMEHDETGEAAMVLVPAKDSLAARDWGRDCDRGEWKSLAVVEHMPQFLTLPMFDARELERDPVWYRQTTNLYRGDA